MSNTELTAEEKRAIKTQMGRYRDQMAVIDGFVKARVRRSKTRTITASKLYDAYKDYAFAEGLFPPSKFETFLERLANKPNKLRYAFERVDGLTQATYAVRVMEPEGEGNGTEGEGKPTGKAGVEQ